VEVSCEHGNGPSVSIKGGQFLVGLLAISFSERVLLHEVSLGGWL